MKICRYLAFIALALAGDCRAQQDPGFHSCTADFGAGKDWVLDSDRHFINGTEDVQAGGGFGVMHTEKIDLFITGNFMYEGADVRQSTLQQAEQSLNIGTLGGEARYYTATLDPTIRIRPKARFSPYVLGGFGWMRRTAEFTAPLGIQVIYPDYYPLGQGNRSSVNTGVFDAGFGFDYALWKGGLKLYTEVRYFQGMGLNRHSGLLPLVLGVRW